MTAPDAEPLSARNPRVQQLRRLLGRRSARAESATFVIEGPKLVAEGLRAPLEVTEVFIEPSALASSVGDEVAALAGDRGVVVTLVAEGVIDQVGSTVSPQPCVAVARSPLATVTALVEAAAGRPIVVLVGINDPGNAGAVMRSVEAAGAGGVLALGASVDLLNPKVVRASAGSLLRLPVAAEREVMAALDVLAREGYRLIGASAGGGEPHQGGSLQGSVALVMGSETHGLDRAVGDRLDGRVTIAMAGSVESLNVAMAATLLVFEAMRGRPSGPESSGHQPDPFH